MYYISTRGSSASEWLAKTLSMHPQIVCFRATRRFPPYGHGKDKYGKSNIDLNGRPPMFSAEAFMEGLLECTRATHGEKIFGSIHGYHGLRAKDPCEKRGGIFSYIIRHPVSRIDSVNIAYLDRNYYLQYKIPIQNKDIQARTCSLLENSDLMRYTKYPNIPKPDAVKQFRKEKPGQDMLQSSKKILRKILPEYVSHNLGKMKRGISQIKNKLPTYDRVINDAKSQPDEKFYAGLLFVALNREFLNYDSMLFKNCLVNQGIKMEEMVKSKEYYSNHVRKCVAPDLNFTDAYLNRVFLQGKVNIHREKAQSPEEIWKTWPDVMKKVFLHYFEKYNIAPVCKAFDYDISFF
tara:strand:+ start:318 stop:1364 length:1047 start_codon:yes stop_codon:yes gene_type:complete